MIATRAPVEGGLPGSKSMTRWPSVSSCVRSAVFLVESRMSMGAGSRTRRTTLSRTSRDRTERRVCELGLDPSKTRPDTNPKTEDQTRGLPRRALDEPRVSLDRAHLLLLAFHAACGRSPECVGLVSLSR